MKKLLLIIATLSICILRLNAQINLEHTLDGYLMPIIIDDNPEYYYDVYDKSNNIKIYDKNFNLYKNINITPPDNCNRYYTNATALNNDIIFMICFNNINNTSDPNNCINKLYDINGNIIKDLGKSCSAGSFIVYSNKMLYYKMFINSNNQVSYATEIYSISLVNNLNESNYNCTISPFPNPANNIITLPYNLNSGFSEMLIHDINGKLIEKKIIDSSSNNILLDIEGYIPGVYLYSVNGFTQKFVVR